MKKKLSSKELNTNVIATSCIIFCNKEFLSSLESDYVIAHHQRANSVHILLVAIVASLSKTLRWLSPLCLFQISSRFNGQKIHKNIWSPETPSALNSVRSMFRCFLLSHVKKCQITNELCQSKSRIGVKDTRLEVKDTKKNPRPRTAFPMDRTSRGQGQECSRPKPRTEDTGASVLQKKKVFKNIFQAISNSLAYPKFLIKEDLNYKSHDMTSSKFFQRGSFCGTKIS